MVEQIIRPDGGFFEIEYFNDFMRGEGHTGTRPWFADEALVGDGEREIKVGPTFYLYQVPIFIEKRGFPKVTYFLNKYSPSKQKAVIGYARNRDEIHLNIESSDELFRQEILRGESDKLFEDVDGYLTRETTGEEIILEKDVDKKGFGRVESEKRYSVKRSGLEMMMKSRTYELSSEGNGYQHRHTQRTDTIEIKDKKNRVKVEREVGFIHSEGYGDSLSNGCLWRPWECSSFLSESLVEKLYPLLYKKKVKQKT